jgi:hypothetical protein
MVAPGRWGILQRLLQKHYDNGEPRPLFAPVAAAGS